MVTMNENVTKRDRLIAEAIDRGLNCPFIELDLSDAIPNRKQSHSTNTDAWTYCADKDILWSNWSGQGGFDIYNKGKWLKRKDQVEVDEIETEIEI
jgi:hypothetical protein